MAEADVLGVGKIRLHRKLLTFETAALVWMRADD